MLVIYTYEEAIKLFTVINQKYRKIIRLFIWGTVINAQGDSGRISVYLKDASTGAPIMYANVILEGTDIGTASDNHGHYV